MSATLRAYQAEFSGKSAKEKEMKRYTEINNGLEARVDGGYLYIRYTNMMYDGLEQGGRSGRVIRMRYDGTLEEAMEKNEWGISIISNLIRAGDDSCVEVVKAGSLIQ